MKVDAEKDFHGYTEAGMVSWLEQHWVSRRWEGLQRVRIIHGKGEVLIPALRRWCEGKGIPWAPEPGNPGTTILYPARQASPRPSQPREPSAKIRSNRTAAPKSSVADPRDTALFEQEMKWLEERGRQ